MRGAIVVLAIGVSFSPANAIAQTTKAREATEAFRVCRESEEYGDATSCWRRWLEKHGADGHEAEVLVAEERVVAPANVSPPSAEAIPTPTGVPSTAVSAEEGPRLVAAPEGTTSVQPAPAPAPSGNLPAAVGATSLPPLPPPSLPSATVLEDTPRFQFTLAAGHGGASAASKAGTAIGAFGMYRFSKKRGSTVGVPFLLANSFSEPSSTTALLSGVHMGHIVYVQGLGGFVSVPKPSTDDLFGTTSASSKSTLGIGFAFGLHMEVTKVFGINAEVFGVKGVGVDGLIGGVLVGPTFQFYRPMALSGAAQVSAPDSSPEREKEKKGRTNIKKGRPFCLKSAGSC